MNYKEAVKFLFDIPRFSKKPSLAHTEKLLKELGIQNEDKKIIHVAGTNGKGSVCTYINEILIKNDKKTGLFTSPHLVSPNERIRIDGHIIDNATFLGAFEAVKAVSDSIFDVEDYPTFFEFVFAMAMYVFREENVEFIILETGMGGRLDQTNVVKNPIVTVITEIGFDHMAYLGDTIEKIASEKAGIIKSGVPVVFVGDRKECRKVIEETAIVKGCQYYMLTKSMIRLHKKTNKAIDFSLHYSYYESSALRVDSIATYQTVNASLAYMAALLIPEELKFDGHFTSLWEGRMEEVAKGVYVDGAHNEDGIDAFLETVRGMDGEHHLLFSAVSDKEHGRMIQKICESGLFDRYTITKIKSARGENTDNLVKEFERYEKNVVCIDDIKEAFFDATDKRGDATLFCVGSLYLVGSIKEIMQNTKERPEDI